MKNYKTMIAMVAVGMALVATERSAEATLSISGTSYLTQGTGASPVLQVAYSAVDTTLWTYTYTFTVVSSILSPTPVTSNPVSSFTVDASFVNSGSLTSTAGAPGYINSGYVDWLYGSPVNTDTVSFTSAYGPTLGGASADDGSPAVSWSSANVGGSPVPVPAPVPEASTFMAGALMLLPFGIGAVRSLRKERV
jgi:hypothetical protein